MPLPLSFYNNLVHQLHLLYIFFFSRKLVFFGVLCSLVIVLLGLNLTIWILGQVSFQFQHLHLFQMRLQLTSLFHETLLLDLVMSCAIVDTYLVTFWANSCSAVLGVGVSSFSPFAAGAPPSVSAPVSERHRAAAVNELFAHTQYRLVVCYPHRGCVLCTVKEKSNKDMLSLTFSCWNHRTADRWTYFYLDWFQTILWIGLPFGDNKQSYYCT